MPKVVSIIGDTVHQLVLEVVRQDPAFGMDPTHFLKKLLAQNRSDVTISGYEYLESKSKMSDLAAFNVY
ncbi:MAG: hypothetical protein H6568_03710 [Lewinellaceae bacterium]|nr:hypothetical protein [Lewinellaceae bacterium]